MTPRPFKNALLLLASLLFYTWGAGEFVGFLLLSIAANYGLGRALEVYEDRPAYTRFIVAVTVAFNVSLLGYFKYANFFVGEANRALSALGVQGVAWTQVVLPVGISFFTFQAMSYVLDITQRRTRPIRSLIDFALYVSLFPQLIAGPIVRFHLIAEQLRERRVRLTDLYEGMVRFSYGLAKKVIAADSCGAIAEAAFMAPHDEVTTATAWLGTVAYTLQIYLDFSAYSDMAIGLGRLFGFTFPENFVSPYAATSVTDFWRRWHTTLSNWFRDYLYFPLGGSRTGGTRVFFNLSVVFLLTGIWHGADWTFVAWGAYHGVLLIIERITDSREVEGGVHAVVRRATTLALVMLGWVVFRANDLGQALAFYRKMFVLDFLPLSVGVMAVATNRNLALVAIGSLLFFRPRTWSPIGLMLTESAHQASLAVRVPAIVFLVFVLLPYTLLLVVTQDFSPFLYYRF